MAKGRLEQSKGEWQALPEKVFHPPRIEDSICDTMNLSAFHYPNEPLRRISMPSQYFVNGKIFTGKNERDFVSAMKITDGKIEWIGPSEQADAPDPVDLQGKTVVPGFIDAHAHPRLLADIAGQAAITIPEVTNIEEAIAALKKQAEKTPDGGWIEGWGWDETKLLDGRPLNRFDLDRVSTDRPVHVIRSDFHSSAVNSKALELAGIDKSTADPFGGEIQRDENGDPTGIMIENANRLIENAKPKKTEEERIEGIVRTGRRLARFGITSVAEMMGRWNDLSLFRKAEKRGFKQRLVLYLLWEEVKELGIRRLEERDLTGRIRIGGVKLFMDGTISGKTAWMKAPYPGTEEKGMRTCTKEELLEAAEFARRNGIQLAIHAMGDRAIEEILRTFEPVKPWIDDGPSIRIEHASIMRPEFFRKMDGKKIALVPQIIFFFAEYESYRNHLDGERFSLAYPLRTMYEQNGYMALSTDAPATTWAEPDKIMTSIKAAVTRKAYNGQDINRAEKISPEQAVLLFTGKAKEVCRLHETGRLLPGYEADFIVLDEDIFTTDPDRLDRVKVAATYISGEKVC
jgi:hypothetical protein